MLMKRSEFLNPVRAAVATIVLIGASANSPVQSADLEFDNPVGDVVPAGTGLQWSVEAEIAAGYSFVDFNANGGGASRDLVDDANWPSLVGDLRAAIPLADHFGLQLDLGGFRGWPSKLGENTSTGGDGGGLGWYRYGGGHLSYRDPSSHAFGVFGMYGQAFGGEDTPSTQDLAENYVIGAEAQWYGERHTVYVQAGYLDGTQIKRESGYPTSADRDVIDDGCRAVFSICQYKDTG